MWCRARACSRPWVIRSRSVGSACSPGAAIGRSSTVTRTGRGARSALAVPPRSTAAMKRRIPIRWRTGTSSFPGRLGRAAALDRFPVALPAAAHLVLGEPLIVGRRDEGQRRPDLDENDRSDGVRDAEAPVEGDDLLEARALREHGSRALEAVALARDRVHD